MKNILNIPIAFCLIGFSISAALGTSISNSQAGSSDSSVSDALHTADHHAFIFPGTFPFLAFAEPGHHVQSEIEPKSPVYTSWSHHQRSVSPQYQYLNRAREFALSQSARNLIYPFHSFL
jgi:hypothetical protein